MKILKTKAVTFLFNRIWSLFCDEYFRHIKFYFFLNWCWSYFEKHIQKHLQIGGNASYYEITYFF